ncbi:hypothetical protein SAMN05192559_101157 [Halobacillus karajensis]|uniref:hypothetical protein n=1 Tax=Halobacillus karajensis TaxID=195088 RepID=UPI0008A77CF0|nr:hypothetical protein [Halobacillus karajensis]SEH40313.1 hypothetical protein SAMN05192559_101157 [Halobacillus karajensis]
MKPNRSPKMIFLFLALTLIMAIGVTVFFMTRPVHRAENVVERFYLHEQQGEFSDSWELLHSQMKEKFTKGHYIQDRAHVFMNHFGVDTFEFSIGNVSKLDQWTMEKGAKSLEGVYHTKVVQTYKGKYGHFQLHQDVYVTEEKGEWRILWDYNK